MHNSFEGLRFMGVRPNLETPPLPRLQFCDIVLQHPPAPTVSSLLEPPSWGERRRRGKSNAEHFDIVDMLASAKNTLTVWKFSKEQEKPIGEMSSSLFLPDD